MYTRLNRVISVATVSLEVLFIGGLALYYYNSQLNNSKTNTVILEKQYMVKNEEFQNENEKITKRAENKYVKATLIENTDLAIQFKFNYWNQYADVFIQINFIKLVILIVL